jgi:hypothetical protein
VVSAPTIGEMRWPITIAQRSQAPTSGGGIAETLNNPFTWWAKIEATRPQTFYGTAQVDTPVTHFMQIRFLDWLDTTYVISRDLTLPDGSTRTELFRIRRVKEEGTGPLRWLDLEVELEKRTLDPPP